jgi:shikimate kinase
MVNIVLTGFMGAGKSSVGKVLARKTGMEVVDSDDVIEGEAGMSISFIFKRSGEDHFRELEKKEVEKISGLKDHIIITGGGVVLDKKNMEALRKDGMIIYLHAEPETVYERLKDDAARPLLKVPHPKREIKRILTSREPFYKDHDHKVDTDDLSVAQVADKILEIMKST